MLAKKLLLYIILIILFLPLTQTLFNILPRQKLTGVIYSEQRPDFTIRSWASGEYQKRFDNWFGQNMGFREILIRINNQIYYSFFNEAPPHVLPNTCGDPIVLGKERQLYGKSYIDHYLKIEPPVEVEKLESLVREINELELLLKKRNKTLLLLITPSKASICPEYIPGRFKENKEFLRNNYENFVLMLNKFGVNYVDGPGILLREKPNAQYPLFCRGSLHWNDLGAYYVAEKLLKKIEEITNKSLVNISINDILVDYNPVGADKDLAEYLNIIRTPDHYITPHPVIRSSYAGIEYKPKVLFEGGSFNWNLLKIYNDCNVFEKITFCMYNKNWIVYPEKKSIDAQDIGWDKLVMTNDIIILEVNEEFIPNTGSGFVENLLSYLKSNS